MPSFMKTEPKYMFNSSAISLLPIIISPERWREAESLRDRDEIGMQRVTVRYSGGQTANSGDN